MDDHADVVEYAALVKQIAAGIYRARGQTIGLECACVSLFETADVVAQLSGRERAVAILDQLAAAVLSEVPLRNLPTLAPPADSSPTRKRIVDWYRAPIFYLGVALGLVVAALVVGLCPLSAFLGFPLCPISFWHPAA